MELTFKKSKLLPRKGSYVALHNIFPIENKNCLGLVINVKKDPLGFNYEVFEFANSKTYTHHISTLIPLKTVWKK